MDDLPDLDGIPPSTLEATAENLVPDRRYEPRWPDRRPQAQPGLGEAD